MFWLISQAFAGVPLSESELQQMCVPDGTCPQVIGTVIRARSRCGGITGQCTPTITSRSQSLATMRQSHQLHLHLNRPVLQKCARLPKRR